MQLIKTLHFIFLLTLILADSLAAQESFIPRRQSKPPGPPLTPQQAVKKMTVPEGFRVEVVAAEPDIVNPVAMTFDEQGRIWITESLEYPRRSPGKGRDRVKVLEDTNSDGKADRVTIFAEGLNIPSGIAVGHGGVWVANAPDILFMQDTDGDGKADKSEVVVTGFGRRDTHELPNSLTWGPDGWLYGLNGVFNPSHIEYRGKTYDFTCALFRIHPKTREFELFAEGTSNPWGIAFNQDGAAFISACVIDHLWHLTETGYYHRQGGPYPPFTWKIGSIVKHKHQLAAYCGIHYFDSNAYPEKYRKRLYMGNIHGNCLNVDVLERDGSTYFGRANPDFLSANDVWFMPIVQKTGPDGCLYVLDWYDRYHCYQDANRDPKGIDRLHGRLYRIRYKQTPRAKPFDLAEEADDQLVQRLSEQNDYIRSTAQRVLYERDSESIRNQLQAVVFDDHAPEYARMHALWTLLSSHEVDLNIYAQLLNHSNPSYRAWAIRAIGNHRVDRPEFNRKLHLLAQDKSRDVQLQVAITAAKLNKLSTLDTLLEVLAHCGDDQLIPHIVWQNLHPLLEQNSGTFLKLVQLNQRLHNSNITAIMGRITDRLLASRKTQAGSIVQLLELLLNQSEDSQAAADSLNLIAEKVQSGEIADTQKASLAENLKPIITKISTQGDDTKHYLPTMLLAASVNDDRGIRVATQILANQQKKYDERLAAMQALIAAENTAVLKSVGQILADKSSQTLRFRSRVLDALGQLEWDEVADVILTHYPQMEAELQPKAIELLTQRASWSHELIAAVGRKQIEKALLNVNQIRKLTTSRDKKLAEQAKAIWGVVRTQRNPQRERVITDMRQLLRKTPSDPFAGKQVYQKLCAQCHKMYGEGQEVGPDITRNGRNSYEQLLSNVFDPSLVIGPGYQARTVVTTDGRVLIGLPVEDNKQRVVLKVQGGKQEIIPREKIEEMVVSKLSMMPEGIEKQLKPQEIADLFAYITLDRPPTDNNAQLIPGTEAADR